MKKLPSKQENPKGLHRRYVISKVGGEPVDESAEYFVMRLDRNGSDPKHIEACRKAVITYAEQIEDYLPHLANDLFRRYSDFYCIKVSLFLGGVSAYKKNLSLEDAILELKKCQADDEYTETYIVPMKFVDKDFDYNVRIGLYNINDFE